MPLLMLTSNQMIAWLLAVKLIAQIKLIVPMHPNLAQCQWKLLDDANINKFFKSIIKVVPSYLIHLVKSLQQRGNIPDGAYWIFSDEGQYCQCRVQKG